MTQFFSDDEISSLILKIVRGARKELFLVSPYLKLWGQLKDELALAKRRGTAISVVARDSEVAGNDEDSPWLRDQGIRLLAVRGLHAKVYFNEGTMAVGSMNLTASSAQNSHEVALMVTDPETVRQLRDYVLDRLIPLAMSPDVGNSRPDRGRQQPTETGSNIQRGVCVRRGEHIHFDPDRPLCRDCYGEWAQYENPDYPERFCHSCGNPTNVTFAKPLCSNCYARVFR